MPKLEMGGIRLKKPLPSQQPTTPPTRGPPVEAECAVDDRVFASISEPTSLNKEGQMVQSTDAGDGDKNTGRKATGNHLHTFPKNMACQIRNNANGVNEISSSTGYVRQ